MTDGAPDLDLRLVRSFVAVAEELHFGRGAERLHLTQPAVSDHVRRLEEQLEVQLLRRSTRKVELTAAGAVFLDDALHLLTVAGAAVRDARRADRGQIGRLRVGFAPGGLMEVLHPLLDAFRAMRPEVELTVRESGFPDPSGGLAGGLVDVALIGLPISTPGLATAVIATEPRIAALPAAHRLASRSQLSIADLADEAWLYSDTDPAWRAFWCAERERGGPPRYGATVDSLEGIFQAVRGGLAVALVPASVQRAVHWQGVALVPVVDLDPAEVAVAWRAEHDDSLVRAFAAVARRMARGVEHSPG